MEREKDGGLFPHPPVPVPPLPDPLVPPRVIDRPPAIEDVERQLEEEEGKEWAATQEVIVHPRLECPVILPRNRDRSKDAERFREVEEMIARGGF